MISSAYCEIDEAAFRADREMCYRAITSSCVQDLMKKYSGAPSNYQNVLRYDLGQAYFVEKDYVKSHRELKAVAINAIYNPALAQAAGSGLAQIQAINEKIRRAGAADYGNYLKREKIQAVWKNPKNIKVYIQDSPKKNIAKQAFISWNIKLPAIIHFDYVTNPDNADICCYFREQLTDKNIAGLTSYLETYRENATVYLKKVKVEISLKRPDGAYYTDDNLTAIILHETGHALGINYHSENINDILYPTTESYRNINLSNRDVNTIKRLYE